MSAESGNQHAPEVIHFRRARTSDVERFKVLGERGWETAYADFVRPENRKIYLEGDFWSLDRLRSIIEDPCAINLAAQSGTDIVGFITTESLDERRFEVTRLYVDPDRRSRGIGGQLLEQALILVSTAGARQVLVNVFGDNHAGRRFYERHGFVLTEDTVTTVGDQVVSDVWYARSL